MEHFKDKCGGFPKWLDDQTYYTAFTEGWALYAENPLIAQQTDTYKENLMQKFGMLKWQVRALPCYTKVLSNYHNVHFNVGSRTYKIVMRYMVCYKVFSMKLKDIVT